MLCRCGCGARERRGCRGAGLGFGSAPFWPRSRGGGLSARPQPFGDWVPPAPCGRPPIGPAGAGPAAAKPGSNGPRRPPASQTGGQAGSNQGRTARSGSSQVKPGSNRGQTGVKPPPHLQHRRQAVDLDLFEVVGGQPRPGVLHDQAARGAGGARGCGLHSRSGCLRLRLCLRAKIVCLCDCGCASVDTL